MKIDLTGKHAPVTSATGDLGRVMIRTLVECGADVVIYYGKNEEYAGKLVEETSASGKKAIAVQADITDFESVMKMRDYVIKNIGTPDIISVVGDTVGDRLKDTAGSALNPMIKVMNLISLLAAPVLVQYKAEELPLPLSC